jgi:hypothetical protein
MKAAQQSTEAATMIASHLFEANRPVDLIEELLKQ